MPAPTRPNVDAAVAARRRIGDNTAAARLEAAGWTVNPPGETPPVNWRNLADRLAQRLEAHAFCDQHPVGQSDPECPFCRDRTVYWAYRRAVEGLAT